MEKWCRAEQVRDDSMAHAHCMLDNYGYRCCVISIALPVQQRLHARVSLVTSHGRCMSCYTSVAKSYNKRVYDLRHVTSKERHKRCCRKFKWASSTAKCHHITTGLKCGKNGHLTCTVLHGHLKHLDRNSNTVQSKSCPGGGGEGSKHLMSNTRLSRALRLPT